MPTNQANQVNQPSAPPQTHIDPKPRVERIRLILREKGLDAILLRKRRHFTWVTGGSYSHIVQTIDSGVADLVIFPDKVVCIATKMESARIAEEELQHLDCEWISPEWYEGHEAALRALCQGKKVGTDGSPEAAIPDATDVSLELNQLAYTLVPEEIERYRWLAQTAARALESTCREITPGMTEYEIQALLASKVLPHGIQPHVILVATDERIFRYRHPIPTAKPLHNYAMIVICAEKWGLIANCTRFVHFGPLSAELTANKTKLASIDLTMNLTTRPGTAIQDVFDKGIQAYAQAGFPDDWRYLHQGGPTGYATREFLATPTVQGTVQLHQAFAWNPAIRGIKSEDTILVGETENEFLTHTGDWNYIEVEHEGKTYLRPDILVRE